MNKSRISFYFIFIGFFTLITILLTIVQASYNNLTNPSKQIEANKFLDPLNPVLDSEIIGEINKRQDLSENGGEIIINNPDSPEANPVSARVTNIPITTSPKNNTQPISTTEDNN